MGKLNFQDLKGVIDYNANSSNKGYGFPLMPRLNTIIGNLENGQVHTISGMASSGITSFIDQNYVITLLLQWYNTDPSERKPLKIFYYSLKDTELKKLQLLLCNYLKVVEGLRTDIPTLNSQIGKLYDVKTDINLQNGINNSKTFFDEILDDEILDIKHGQYKPSDIYNDIIQFMQTIGSGNSKTSYVLDDEFQDYLVLVIVDPVEYLSDDVNGFGIISGNELIEDFQNKVKDLKITYGVSFVLSVPSNIGYIRGPKDTEPKYRHLSAYGKVTDKGICIYNPVAENNSKYYGGDADIYTSPKGNILMRTWHVVKNTDGIDSIYGKILFLPGTSFMIEQDIQDKIEDLDDVLDRLSENTVFNN